MKHTGPDRGKADAISIVGLPGVGKTRTALALAHLLSEKGRSVCLLHTDVIKVMVRELYPAVLKGPGYGGDICGKGRVVEPWLSRYRDKARKDGDFLIVEGSLAWILADVCRVRLDLEGEVWRRRVEGKPTAAKQAILTHDLLAYQRLLQGLSVDLALSAVAEPVILAQEIVAQMKL